MIQIDDGQLPGGEVKDQAPVVQIDRHPAFLSQGGVKIEQVVEHTEQALGGKPRKAHVGGVRIVTSTLGGADELTGGLVIDPQSSAAERDLDDRSMVSAHPGTEGRASQRS